MARKTTLETVWYIPDDLWDKVRPLLGREKRVGRRFSRFCVSGNNQPFQLERRSDYATDSTRTAR
jgi:hypothetical protein